MVRYGAYFTIYTGLIIILGDFAFGLIIYNDPKMKIPFANEEDGVVFIDPQFGWSWYLTLFTGIGTFFIGIAVLLMDYFFPRQIATFFHHSILEEDDFFQVGKLSVSYLQICISLCFLLCSLTGG